MGNKTDLSNRHQVTLDENDMRLDRWVQRQFPALNFVRVQKLLRTGQVRLEGKRVSGSERLVAGQEIRFPPALLDPPVDNPEIAEAKPLPKNLRNFRDWIIYDDADLLVLNKPAGLAVQGGSKTFIHLDGMLDHFQFDYQARPKLVHRLDKETSGLLVLAHHIKAAQYLTEAFRDHSIRKTYWALVSGVPKIQQGEIKAKLQKMRAGQEEMVRVTEEGQTAITDYQVVENAGQKYAWLALWPKTGRTHQLRVHCQLMGTPICGDDKYGFRSIAEEEHNFDRNLYLHARAITIPHPGKKPLTLSAPLPAHMQEAWKLLGFDEKNKLGKN